jgi:hypothetical protein
MSYNNFLGQDGFIWFTAVVEDRQDPSKLGRVRVRCLGYHTEDKTVLPTSDLPWAHVLLPITSSGISGIGQTPLGLLEGSWVFGFFRDALHKQEPVIIGSLPGRPSEIANTSKGFYDPNGVYPRYINEPDTNRLAVNDENNPHLGLELRKASRITGLATADFDADTAADGSSISASDTDTWAQPEIAYNAVYPYNHVFESESGHVLEFDDTSIAERIYLAHKTGTSTEYNPNGDRIDIIKGDQYTLTSADNKVNIDGLSDITIGGRHKIYINKDGAANNNYDIQVGPNANVNIQVDTGDINLVTKQGKVNVNSGGDYNLKVKGNMRVAVEGNILETVEGTKTSNTSGAVIHRGSTIDLNP